MTRTRKVVVSAAAGLALSAVAAGAIAAIVRYRTKSPEGLEQDNREKLSELIRRLGAVERGSDDPEVVALRMLLEKLERETGDNARRLGGWLGRVRSDAEGLDEDTLAYAEQLVDRIEERASREGI